MIGKKLIQAVHDQYVLDWQGIHGIVHWGRVYTNGLRLAAHTGARLDVVKLFSIFHDSRRLNNNIDNTHGSRGAMLAEEFRGRYFDLPDEAFELLITACKQHTISLTHSDITVQTCFDADRLDLGRVGKTPDPGLLCTDAAKTVNMISWATERSTTGYVPDIVSEWEAWEHL
ncbi:hypothetical protein ACOHYD_10220 [Desulfobacterota bacterium M19]